MKGILKIVDSKCFVIVRKKHLAGEPAGTQLTHKMITPIIKSIQIFGNKIKY